MISQKNLTDGQFLRFLQVNPFTAEYRISYLKGPVVKLIGIFPKSLTYFKLSYKDNYFFPHRKEPVTYIQPFPEKINSIYLS